MQNEPEVELTGSLQETRPQEFVITPYRTIIEELLKKTEEHQRGQWLTPLFSP
jgi:hypothetical protein